MIAGGTTCVASSKTESREAERPDGPGAGGASSVGS